MEDSEKLTALKKAYADIILNTAKEAAARIMVSERKATRFQQELVSTKEEALRMLLRLKQKFDSKVSEAELTSLNQQKKIEELEAQLQEAEEIVRDLRAELRETQAELENVTKHQMHPPVEQNTGAEIEAQEIFLQENRLDPYDGSVYTAPGLQFESVSISDNRNPVVNGSNDSSKFCGSHDHTNNCYIHNPDFASIVIRRKEPKLYRNGCTQRIHAFERSLFDGNMSVSGNLDNVQNEMVVSVHEEGKAMTVSTNAKADTISEKEKPDELKVVKADADLVKVPVQRKKIKFGKRNAIKSRLHSNQVKETNKESHLSGAKDSSLVLDNDDPSRVSSSMTCENEAQKDLMSPFADVPTDTTATNEQSGPHSNTENGEVFLKACSIWNITKDDNEPLDKSDLTRQESLSAESVEVPACKDVEASNGSLDKMDPKVSNLDEKVSNRSTGDKFKYTFCRKRKKEAVSCDDVDCSQDNTSSKKKCGEKQDGHVEPQKSCTMTESSRDSRRLAQVARQLISLSEKKWWQ
ncbi:hypothetical protein AAZX31_17G091600 [Glycine max]|uniref:Uncharacterized protein n=4 Tax=Glycine subgen. Soja TaxID=1462606 RepID=K7MKT1_SOYBN|nr:uncharacterized protein LOC100797926 isoform X1 [Glycine max]XP_028208623.1 uncharacterized protein LOC114391838 isoform X1 [Glycine soja]KAG4932727.1 hypothetical protein JHK87_046729 [Glycine soja]KAG5097185.1 hypothetical protein JHK82_047039 [Glycine max]KAH1117648.1 hypothetical protein GYH30_046763 [Glycine max]KAH1201682.1 hypothetical protein GmHk_17G048316 [Glycine max]KRH03382.1 hypothetical protein GLYMA_17G094200v4 [Glycine max]|eukprot:XP_006600661.1 uncharacterized protein LOC100797926 isoform X2 [Glycine max]